MKTKTFTGYFLSDVHELGADLLLQQDLHLTVPGDESTVIYRADEVLAEIARHDNAFSDEEDKQTFRELEAALRTLPPETNIFI